VFLYSSHGSDQTVLTGNGGPSGISIDAHPIHDPGQPPPYFPIDVWVHGFTVTDVVSPSGASCLTSTETALMLIDTKFEGCEGGWYGAVRVQDRTLRVVSSHFTDNEAPLYGGALSFYGEELWVVNSSFAGNEAFRRGGALSVIAWDGAVLDGVVFDSNWAGDEGGALHLGWSASTSTAAELTNVEFHGNESYSGGAISSHGDLEIHQGLFTDNESGSHGSAIRSTTGDVSLHAVECSGGNSAGSGCTVYAQGAASIVIEDSRLLGNESGGSGAGGTLISDGTIEIRRTEIRDNLSGGATLILGAPSVVLENVSVVENFFESAVVSLLHSSVQTRFASLSFVTIAWNASPGFGRGLSASSAWFGLLEDSVFAWSGSGNSEVGGGGTLLGAGNLFASLHSSSLASITNSSEVGSLAANPIFEADPATAATSLDEIPPWATPFVDYSYQPAAGSPMLDFGAPPPTATASPRSAPTAAPTAAWTRSAAPASRDRGSTRAGGPALRHPPPAT